ncbi:hypothetical protein AB1Y20_022562 [Prymnesium parvum]|uniref:RRM domain-containing protein n=1 Tax=Prymnesium parvum TaxID=97485 RepID=A0AB34JJC0_PRYPA
MDDARSRAFAAAQEVAARLSAAVTCGAGLGCASHAAADAPAAPFASHAATFLASLGAPPSPPRARRTGFDVAPPPAAALTAQQQAMAAAMRLAESLSGGGGAPSKSLDALLARDRARIAAAHERNLEYVLQKEREAKERAKAAAAAAAAVAAAQADGAGAPYTQYNAPYTIPRDTPYTIPRARTKLSHTQPFPSSFAFYAFHTQPHLGQPPAKVARKANTPNVAACSIYVTGLPADTNALEVQEHFQIVSPVSRVKFYKDAAGKLKGDCLVTFDKDAAVIGAVQLLNQKMLRPGVPLTVSRAVFSESSPDPPPPPPPPPADLSEIKPVDDALRVVVVSNLFDPADVPPLEEAERRSRWIAELTDDLWSECCRHGEVEAISLMPDHAVGQPCAAVRFQSLIAAASAVDALNGRHFEARELYAAFDDGSAAALLPAESDTARQERFGFGEIAQAYQESIRLLTLAAAEGARFISCASFVCELELYEYRTADDDAAVHGPGYYRRDDAPPPDPLEQSRAILQQACAAGAAFISCAERIIDELPLYTYRDGPEGKGYYRHAGAPPSADPREQSLMLMREASAAAAAFVRCLDFVGAVTGYDFREEGEAGAHEGTGYYRRDDAPPPDEWEYSRMVLERASAAGAEFVAIPQAIMELRGYEFKDGPEGTGYYLIGANKAAPHSFDEFLSDMKELGAI